MTATITQSCPTHLRIYDYLPLLSASDPAQFEFAQSDVNAGQVGLITTVPNCDKNGRRGQIRNDLPCPCAIFPGGRKGGAFNGDRDAAKFLPVRRKVQLAPRVGGCC